MKYLLLSYCSKGITSWTDVIIAIVCTAAVWDPQAVTIIVPLVIEIGIAAAAAAVVAMMALLVIDVAIIVIRYQIWILAPILKNIKSIIRRRPR